MLKVGLRRGCLRFHISRQKGISKDRCRCLYRSYLFVTD